MYTPVILARFLLEGWHYTEVTMEETDEIMRVFVAHLKKKGLDLRMIPIFMRDLAHAINNYNAPWKINSSLHLMGWNEFELDYRTLELADACLRPGTFFHSDGYSERLISTRVLHKATNSS